MEKETTRKAAGRWPTECQHWQVAGNNHQVMKVSKMFSDTGKGIPARHASKGSLAAVLVVLIGISWDMAICRAQQPDNDVPGAQVLTRGPVHEAFAGMVTFNPEPGVVVTKPPPDVIEEVPPEQRPEGDNVTWIPGYWAWDDERSDFLWVSGTWRALPPGRQWMAGYWGKTPQGYQWISGYWADATARETTYLPPPPATVEVGPNVAAPSMDYGWTPGCWIWYQGRYAWRPGYWALGQADWDWIPAHYVWTPRGYIFVGGFWDYSVERRGVLFAPVYFESGVYSRRGYFYSPTIVINLGVFTDHLFLRPRYHHYYFGDYYAANYSKAGSMHRFRSNPADMATTRSILINAGRIARTGSGSTAWKRHTSIAAITKPRGRRALGPPRETSARARLGSDQNRVLVATPINQLAKTKRQPHAIPAGGQGRKAEACPAWPGSSEIPRSAADAGGQGHGHDSPKTGRGIRAGQGATSQIPDCGQAGQTVGKRTRLRPRRSRHPNRILRCSPSLRHPVASQTRTGAILNPGRASPTLRPSLKAIRTRTTGTKAKSSFNAGRLSASDST